MTAMLITLMNASSSPDLPSPSLISPVCLPFKLILSYQPFSVGFSKHCIPGFFRQLTHCSILVLPYTQPHLAGSQPLCFLQTTVALHLFPVPGILSSGSLSC